MEVQTEETMKNGGATRFAMEFYEKLCILCKVYIYQDTLNYLFSVPGPKKMSFQT